METIQGGMNKAFDLIDEELKKTYRSYPAKYEDQKNNIFDGNITCALTSVSMILQTYNLPEYGGAIACGDQEEDAMLKDIRENFPKYQQVGIKLGIGSAKEPPSEQYLRKDFNFLKWYVQNRYGVTLKLSSCQKVQLNRIVDGLEKPMVMSTSCGLTRFGHIILARGKMVTQTGLCMIANDPFGRYPYTTRESGEAVVYDMKLFPTTGSDGAPATYYMLTVEDYPKK